MPGGWPEGLDWQPAIYFRQLPLAKYGFARRSAADSKGRNSMMNPSAVAFTQALVLLTAALPALVPAIRVRWLDRRGYTFGRLL